MAVSLPGEILLEILSRLPRKSQRRFEIVSKEWANLIKEVPSLPAKSTDFGFVVAQYYYQKIIYKTIFYRLDDKGDLAVEDTISFPFPYCIWTMGSCNGVVFYCKQIEVDDNYKLSYHLYNPCTKHHTNLPPLIPFRMEHDPIPAALGVAPHSRTNHYKLMVAYIRPSRDTYRTHSLGLKVAIFDSETRKWKTKPAKFSEESDDACANLCFNDFELGASNLCFEQSLYWVGESCLIVFCLRTETFRVLDLPTAQNQQPGVLWESEGRLKYTQICHFLGLCIWVLQGEAKLRGNWEMIFRISIPTLNSLLAETIKCPLHKRTWIISVSAFNEHLQMFHLQTNESLCVSYHILNKKMTLVSPLAVVKDALLLPFSYCKHDLPDLGGTDPGSATGKRERSRKRSLTSSPTTLRRSTRIKRAQT